MRELRLLVAADRLEAVLDRLLPLLPGGVREIERGDGTELVIRGEALPSRRTLAVAAGRGVRWLAETEVPDDPGVRRRLDHRPLIVAGRIAVRPEWADPVVLPAGGIEIVLGESTAFGTGEHPTTEALLAELAALPPAGALADLGCGSGVLAIAAAGLGWRPVTAVDLNPAAVAAAVRNAALSGAEVSVRCADLTAVAPPLADAVVANVPAAVHAALALGRPLPAVVLIGGFGPDAAADVHAGYLARGLELAASREVRGWTISRLICTG